MNRTADQLEVELADLKARHADALAEIARLEALLDVRNVYYLFDGDDMTVEDPEDWVSNALPEPGIVTSAMVWLETRCTVWFAYLAESVDQDGEPDECEIREYDTERAALEAVEASGVVHVSVASRLAELRAAEAAGSDVEA